MTHRDSDAGMTLAEVLIASSILLVCLIALAGVLSGAIASSSMARARDEAMNLANARIEAARNLPYDSVGVRYANGASGEPSGTILTPESSGRFTVTTRCAWVQSSTGRAAYKRINITVSWSNPSNGKVEVNSIIYGKSNVSGAGDFLVRLRYRESADPVAGSEVTLIAADGSIHSVSTDEAGEVLFGQVPVGPCTLQVTPPFGYVVDPSTLANAAVSADAVSTAIVYLQHPASATVRVKDMSGVAIVGAVVAIRSADGATAASAVTGADGAAAFAQLLFGDYTATVSAVGYASASLPFAVTTSETGPIVEFRMSPGAVHGIRVRVFDANGIQVPGAAVVLTTQAGAAVSQGSTGSNGEISFTLTTAGTYVATVSSAGYVTQSKSQTLQDADEEVVTFSLAAVQTKGDMHILTTGKNNKLQHLHVVVSGPGGYFASNLESSDTGDLWLYSLVPGSYSVQIFNDSGSAVTTIVTAGQTANVAVSQRN